MANFLSGPRSYPVSLRLLSGNLIIDFSNIYPVLDHTYCRRPQFLSGTGSYIYRHFRGSWCEVCSDDSRAINQSEGIKILKNLARRLPTILQIGLIVILRMGDILEISLAVRSKIGNLALPYPVCCQAFTHIFRLQMVLYQS
jgi:hypothetical protein